MSVFGLQQFKIKKILKSAGGSSENRLREPMWYIRLWRSPPAESFIIYDESSSPGTDDYLIDAGYPIETYI